MEKRKLWSFVSSSSASLHGDCARWTKPLSTRSRLKTDTSVVKPLDRALKTSAKTSVRHIIGRTKYRTRNVTTYVIVVTRNHVAIRHVVANAITSFVGVDIPRTCLVIHRNFRQLCHSGRRLLKLLCKLWLVGSELRCSIPTKQDFRMKIFSDFEAKVRKNKNKFTYFKADFLREVLWDVDWLVLVSALPPLDEEMAYWRRPWLISAFLMAS